MTKKISLITGILLSVWAMSMPSVIFAAWLDTLLQSAAESLRPKETIEKINKSVALGNVYGNAYTLAKKEFTASTSQAIYNVTQNFNTNYNCSLSLADMWAILWSIENLSSEIQGALASVKDNIDLGEGSSFAWACVKMIDCISAWTSIKSVVNASKWRWQPVSLTTDAVTTCQNHAANTYKNSYSKATAMTSLASTNVGNDIYYNGTLDDSPYDILVDIQNIGDVLFSNNEQTDNIIFYTFPSSSVAWLQAIPFGPMWGSVIWWWQSTAWNDKKIPTSTTNTTNNTAVVPVSPASSSSRANTRGTFNTTTIQQENTLTDIAWPTITKTLTPPPTSTPTPISNSNPSLWSTTNNIQNFVCIAPVDSSNTIWNTSIPTNNTWSVWTSYWWTTTWVSTSTPTHTPAQNTGWTPIVQPTFNSNTPYYSPLVTSAIDPVNNTSRESPSDYAAKEAEIQSCVNKCDGLWAADKALCIAKCMCWTSYTKDGIFGISICTVPTFYNDVVREKSVQSIQDIISEINNVLTALRNSGQLTKSTKTKEFIDTSLSKIKINQTLAFDFNIAFKPILDTKPRFANDIDSETTQDQQARWQYASIDIWVEKNKYVNFFDIATENALKNQANTVEDTLAYINAEKKLMEAQTNLILQPTISEALAKSQNAEVADILKDFIEQNIRFWTYATDSIKNIQQTSDLLHQKIQKGK